MLKTMGTFCALVQRDMVVFRSSYFDRCINAMIWGSLVVIVFQHIMPAAGLANHGLFIAVSGIASWGLFEVNEKVARFVADLDGDRAITYYLTLPIPQWAVFVRLAVSNALQAMSVAILLLPFFKLILGSVLSFSNASWLKFVIIFILSNLFFGFFSLSIMTRVQRLDQMGKVWYRNVMPLWWLGCFQFSWAMLYSVVPNLALLNLLNPLVYIMEGMRASILGQTGYLPFWNCCAALSLSIVIVAFIGVYGLRKKLDCL